MAPICPGGTNSNIPKGANDSVLTLPDVPAAVFDRKPQRIGKVAVIGSDNEVIAFACRDRLRLAVIRADLIAQVTEISLRAISYSCFASSGKA